jgi:hypothetical protein
MEKAPVNPCSVERGNHLLNVPAAAQENDNCAHSPTLLDRQPQSPPPAPPAWRVNRSLMTHVERFA